jgi:uncharacterized protein YoxC
MSGLTENITIFSIIIIAAIIFVAVGVFVMFAILCANVAQIKKTLKKLLEEVRKRKSEISIDYLKPRM